jgi:predicted enzyme related to lactoylglutathione lyase
LEDATQRENTVNLASVRIITDDVARLTEFYELVTGVTARRYTPDFAEVVTRGATLAIGGTATVRLFGDGSAEAAANRTAIVEFRVDDVDAEFARLRPAIGELVQAPTTMPWGNRSLLFRDPDGTLVNLFTPVSAEAITRQAR